MTASEQLIARRYEFCRKSGAHNNFLEMARPSHSIKKETTKEGKHSPKVCEISRSGGSNPASPTITSTCDLSRRSYE
jgi:hypothetical protein